ncbi:hypothetical protein EVAR_96453_1 [Eumeta japonica]|uniref:Uncharacterized protein n=1 Tax=Eumeta variegata TaxID=151549 RepID=A0A4C1VUS8_EUMVA|nr:hypothetical protein EVAR_96453_1 [Eumeta japonica]
MLKRQMILLKITWTGRIRLSLAIRRAQFRKQKREKKYRKKKMAVNALMKVLSKPENKETECQEDIQVVLTSIALNQEAMDLTEEIYLRSSEGESSKTREGTTEEPAISLS